MKPEHRRLLFAEARRYRGWIAAALVLGAATAALGAVEPLFLQYLTDLMVRAGGHGRAAPAGDFHAGAWALALLGLVLGAGRALQTGQSALVNRIRFGSSFDLSSRVLGQLYAQPLSFHQQSGAGYVLTRVDRGIAALGQLTSELLQSLVPNSINLVLMLALLLRLSPKLAAVALAPMPLFLWATLRGAGRLSGHEEAVQESWSRLYSRVSEVLSGIKTVKSLAGEQLEVAAYQRQARAIFARLWRLVWVEEGYGQLRSAVALGARLGVAGYGFWLVLAGALTPGAWIAATSYAALLYGPLAGLAATCSSAARQWVAAGVVLEFLAGEPAAAAAPVARAAPLARLRGEIRFEQVSFAYPATDGGRQRFAIDGVSFRIEPGETIAVIGPSGGGKTTLMDLLLRFHDPCEGRILLDRRDLRSVLPADLRQQVAVVLQEPLLLQGSIADNLAYGAPDPAAVTDARLRAALRAAQAEEFVGRLPQGLDTCLGEGGTRLSGGEKQRLAIARALLRDPRILILDEATAHLDAASEEALNQALRALVADRTALVISHRLATLLPTDRIFVLARGQLQEQGTAQALAASGGFYARWLVPAAT
ncbi:MAG: ABC transporter ATP-binding protein [Terriglobales bacterium]